MYRQRAADAKNRAAQAKDRSMKDALERLAADWVALAEQVERIDGEKPETRPVASHAGRVLVLQRCRDEAASKALSQFGKVRPASHREGLRSQGERDIYLSFT